MAKNMKMGSRKENSWGGITTAEVRFPVTSLTEIGHAQQNSATQAHKALDSLCRKYWQPLYGYLRFRGHSRHDAQDITQGFFVNFLSRQGFVKFDPNRGKLRSYLLGALKHYESNWRRDKRAVKRGGKYDHFSFDWLQAEQLYASQLKDAKSPDLLFDKQWILTLLDNAHIALRKDYCLRGKGKLFDALCVFMDGSPDGVTQAEVARHLDMTVNSVKMALVRMRKRRKTVIQAHVRETVSSDETVYSEIDFLLDILRGS